VTSAKPEVRSLVAKTALKNLDAVGPEHRAKLRPEIIEEVESASLLSWIPIQSFVAIERAANSLPSVQQRIYRKQVSDQLTQQPLLQGSLGLIVRMLGFTPRTMLKGVPSINSIVTRNCGVLEVTNPEGQDQNMVQLLWTSIPPECSDPEYVQAAYGQSLEPIFGRCGCEGTIAVRLELSKQRATYVYRWKRSAPKPQAQA
jgi:hypothetical protein